MKTLAAAVILILAGSSLSFAAPACSTYTFYGTIIVAARDYPMKYEVHLLSNMGEEPIGHTFVDMTNRFVFDGLPSGRFDVVVHVERFRELRVPVDIGSSMSAQATGGCIVRDIFWLLPLERPDETWSGYPPDATREYDQAVRAENNMRFDEAAKHLETAIGLAPDWFDAHSDLGAVYEKLNRAPDAASQYRKALELKPDSVRALLSLGRLLLDESDKSLQDPQNRVDVKPALSEARELISRAIVADPMSAMASFLLGGVDFRLMDYKSAELELQHALELDPKMFQARITLANLYINQKKWQEALDQIDSFALEFPNSPYRQQMITTRTSVIRRLQSMP